MGRPRVRAPLSFANSKVTIELNRGGITDQLPAFLALPRSPDSRQPLRASFPAHPTAAAQPHPERRPLAVKACGWSRLRVLPSASQLGRARLAPPIGGLLSPLPAPPMRCGRAPGLVALHQGPPSARPRGSGSQEPRASKGLRGLRRRWGGEGRPTVVGLRAARAGRGRHR